MSAPEPSRPGSVLRAEREALGVTVREVAETLNLSMSVIEAIEEDDIRRLPGPVFARGYVRAYARLLELEPEPLVDQYAQAPPPTPMVQGRAESPVWEWIRRRPGLVLGGAGGMAAALLTLLVVWVWPEPQPEVERGVTDAQTGPAGLPGALEPDPAYRGETASAAERVDSLAGRSRSQPTPDEVAPDGAGSTVVSATAADTSETRQGTALGPEAGGNVRRITDSGDDRLTLRFSDDCWVEVHDAGGSNLYSDLSRADSELVLLGQGPFRILLGYAPGAELSFNGEPVPLAPHTRNNVATLVLGQ